MAITETITTADQLLRSHPAGRCELVRGELIMMSPAGFEHGRVASRINGQLERFVSGHALGIVTGAETGFQIASEPDTVRAPDVGFVAGKRLPEGTIRGYFPGAPDLAVEVLSPNDLASEVLDKVKDWLAAGCQMVWVIDPQSHTVTEYRADRSVAVFDETASIDGGRVLPGFSLPVVDIFALPSKPEV